MFSFFLFFDVDFRVFFCGVILVIPNIIPTPVSVGVLFKRNFALGRWTASGIKTKRGFTIVNENRQEWEILIDGEYRTL